jgi:hypothetical protein
MFNTNLTEKIEASFEEDFKNEHIKFNIQNKKLETVLSLDKIRLHSHI